MADNDRSNDEYQFADLDAGGSEAFELSPEGSTETVKPESKWTELSQNSTKRNAILASVFVLLMMGLYQLVGWFSSDKSLPAKPIIQPPSKPRPFQQAVKPAPLVTPAAPTIIPNQVNQKLADIELNAQNMNAKVEVLGNQATIINNNVNTLAARFAELNDVINKLSLKIADQSREIEQLTIRKTVATASRRVSHRPAAEYLRYYLQAVIPGRAWLIATNGATLTVREGTGVPGYGVVRLIDPQQGRVLTSSGRVIKFSQEDS